MKSFKSIFSAILMLAAIGATMTSCSDAEPEPRPALVLAYSFFDAETGEADDYNEYTFSAEGQTHEFLFGWSEKNLYWDQEEAPGNCRIIGVCESIEGMEDTYQMAAGESIPDAVSADGLSFSAGWIKGSLVPTDRNSRLTVELLPNDTGLRRQMIVDVGIQIEHTLYLGQLTVIQLAMEEEESYYIQAIYKGRQYSTVVNIDGYGNMSYEDQEFHNLISSLDQKESVETVIEPDGIIHFYDSEEMKTSLKLKAIFHPENLPQSYSIFGGGFLTRGDAFAGLDSSKPGGMAVYDDNNFSDRDIKFNLNGFESIYALDDLSRYSMNDKISSVAVTYNATDETVCSVLTLWNDDHYNYADKDGKKHRITFIANKDNRQMSWKDLKSIPYLGGGGNWNDKASSLIFHAGYYGNKPNDR